jgi:Tfp pilus assembly protein PilN
VIKINLASKKGMPTASASPSGPKLGSGITSLFKFDFKTPSASSLPIKSIAIAALVWFGGDFFLEDYKKKELDQLEVSVQKLQQERSKHQGAIAQMRGYEDAKVALEAQENLARVKLETIEKLIEGRHYSARFLKDLSKIIPEKVWLTSLALETGEANFEGQAKSFNFVTDFMRQLNESVYFKDADAKQESSKSKDGADISIFRLNAKRR